MFIYSSCQVIVIIPVIHTLHHENFPASIPVPARLPACLPVCLSESPYTQTWQRSPAHVHEAEGCLLKPKLQLEPCVCFSALGPRFSLLQLLRDVSDTSARWSVANLPFQLFRVSQVSLSVLIRPLLVKTPACSSWEVGKRNNSEQTAKMWPEKSKCGIAKWADTKPCSVLNQISCDALSS